MTETTENQFGRQVTLEQGQVAMFGYGSLLLQRSMELTLGRPYSRSRFPCALVGWRRSWDVIMPNLNFYEATPSGDFVPQNIIYLNIRRDSGACMNGLLYILDTQELESFDKREWIYDRHLVTAALEGVEVIGGEAYAYVAKAEWLLAPDTTRAVAALRQTYLDIVEAGLQELGPDFRAQYECSTDPVPNHLVFTDRKREGSPPLFANVRPR